MNGNIKMKNRLASKWLKGGLPLLPRLSFEEHYDSPMCVSTINEKVRYAVLKELDSDSNNPVFLEDFIKNNGEDEVIAQVDRYGMPYNTVVSKDTGIVRVSPYYSEEWIKRFYNKYYRPLYTNDKEFSKMDVFQDQINRGNYYFNFMENIVDVSSSILEIGCGMGGILFPFKMRGFKVKGIDYGEDFVEKGKEVGLDLTNEEVDDLINNNVKFDLIILSHLLEHIVDLNVFLSKIHKLLTDKGKLFIAVPGIKNIHKAYKKDLLSYLQNAHAWHFSQNTLKAALIFNGFSILKSDEEINCLAQKEKEEDASIETINELLKFEYDNVTKYLLETEEHFHKKTTSKFNNSIKKSFLDLSLREFWGVKLLIKIKNKIK